MGAGLLGKIGPVFIGILAVACFGLVQLTPDLKGWALGLGIAAAIAYILIAGFIVIAHPILGNMDGRDALQFLRAEIKAKNPQVITGTSRPVANKSPAAGITQQRAGE